MAELKNPKHEKFVQNIVRGLSPTEAYNSAGYSRKGAHASAARLLKNPQVCTRLAELQRVIAPLVEAAPLRSPQKLSHPRPGRISPTSTYHRSPGSAVRSLPLPAPRGSATSPPDVGIGRGERPTGAGNPPEAHLLAASEPA